MTEAVQTSSLAKPGAANFDCRGAGAMIKIGENIADGKTGIKTEEDHLVAGAVKQLFLRKPTGA